MEIVDLSKQEEPLPALIRHISSNEVAGFDSIHGSSTSNTYQYHPSGFNPFSSSAKRGTETAAFENCPLDSKPSNHQRMHSISISMPSSPIGHSSKNTKRALCEANGETVFSNGIPVSSAASKTIGTHADQIKFLSQPIPKGYAVEGAVNIGNFPHHQNMKKLKDKRYDSFKTWSGRFERQISHLRGKPLESPPQESVEHRLDKDALPVDRYYDALEGPELENLRVSEEIVLPEDKTWPFLLRFPVTSFGICLGTSSQAILWKTLATSASTKFIHVSPIINLVLWCISLALVVVVSSIYILKIILYFEAVRREYYHPIRINFFFSPWIAFLFLALGVPPSVANNLHAALWYVLMTPFLCLALKIYGQWMSGGQRRLSKVANPTNHLSVVGNFVGALLGASLGLKEGPIFFFSVGLAHYIVLFVTLYQRLPTNKTLPKELHPVFFLFVAAPSVASMAWAKIQGSFDYGSRIAYFIALFLYFSLAVRINFFRGFKFSLAWWAYTFPMTAAAIATIRYSNEVTNGVTQTLEVLLSAISTLVVTALFVTTIIHAFVLRDLFPNDIAIAISDRKPKYHSHQHIKWLPHRRLGSLEKKEIENYLKFATSESDCNDIEASINPARSEDSK